MTVTTANLTGGPATIAMDGVDLGGTKGGVKLNITEELTMLECDQLPMAVGVLQNAQGATVTLSLAEMTLDNLNAILRGTGGGGYVGAPEAKVFTIVGRGPAGKTRTITLHKGIIKANTEIDFSKDQQTLPIEIILLADTTQTNGKYLFSVVDSE